jgi:hypothetical protein
MKILVMMSVGELLDKISILEIKEERIKDETKLLEIKKELSALREECVRKLKGYEDWIKKIKVFNEEIWDLEEDARKEMISDDELLRITKRVYFANDSRFLIKNQINEFYGSEIKEQKSHKNCDPLNNNNLDK